jgi:hypothetical protein
MGIVDWIEYNKFIFSHLQPSAWTTYQPTELIPE